MDDEIWMIDERRVVGIFRGELLARVKFYNA
jgi:hypothetical protein